MSQIQAIGSWMSINGPGIYGSQAWVVFGEGANATPFGAFGSVQANDAFTTSDVRFTVGQDGYLYAYVMQARIGRTARGSSARTRRP